MKTEIAYRAYHKEKKIWCEVLLICFVNRYVDVLPEYQLEGGNQESWSFDEIHLMRFTGLKDKEGNEIYEGEMVKLDDDMSMVIYSERYREFMLKGDNFLSYYYFDPTTRLK